MSRKELIERLRNMRAYPDKYGFTKEFGDALGEAADDLAMTSWDLWLELNEPHRYRDFLNRREAERQMEELNAREKDVDEVL